MIGEGANTEGEALWFDDVYFTDHIGDSGSEDTNSGNQTVTELIENGGFEDHTKSPDGIIRPTNWEAYPPELTNYETAFTIDGKGSEFTALEGSASLLVRGSNTGSENETAIYQSFEPVSGATYTISGSAMIPSANPLVDAHTYGMLQIKTFNSSWGMIDSFESDPINMTATTDVWINLEATGGVSSSVAVVQAVATFWQCVGIKSDCTQGEGMVYFDDISFEQSE